MSVDSELRAIAERSAAQYSDSLIARQGWTRQELVDAIHRYERRHRLADGQLYPYECPSGRHYHLTSQTPEQQREIASRIAEKENR